MAAGGESTRPTIVVVDDAAEVRALVRTRLRLSGLLDVVGEAGNGAEAVEAVRELRPALVLLDVSMPVMDGLEALPRILEVSPETRVVMYSGFQEEGLAHRALELGASAFLEKSTALDTLAGELVAAARRARYAAGGPRRRSRWSWTTTPSAGSCASTSSASARSSRTPRSGWRR